MGRIMVTLCDNSFNCWELLVRNGKDNQQPSQRKLWKVQRLDREIVHSSEWKWGASLVRDEDIVLSYWKQ